MSVKRRLISDERGTTLVLVVLLISALTIVCTTLLMVVQGETSRGTDAVRRDAAFQAAESGIDDYLAKFVDNPAYDLQEVHPAESTRRSSTGNTVGVASTQCDASGDTGTAKPAPASWTYGATWTYASKDHWCQLGNGYEYNLQITHLTATTPGAPTLRIVATGRLVGSTKNQRVIEVLTRQSTIADFQMLADDDISYGATATTAGKIYAGIDPDGHKHWVDHEGKASADIYAEDTVYGNTTLLNGAKRWDGNPATTTIGDIRTQIHDPINFSAFTQSQADVKRVAQFEGGTHFPYLDASTDAWQLTFKNNGTVVVQSCTRFRSGRVTYDVAVAAPTCSAGTAWPLPAKGAIYSEVPVIVSGVVNGRVTVVSNVNIVVSGNIQYLSDVDGTAPKDDVLGLIGKSYVFVAAWAPSTLTWHAATLAQEQQWRSYYCPNDGDGAGTMTFIGSTATMHGGCMTQYDVRNYNYDPSLLYLPPPWFPTIGGAYTILVFRELPSS
jgi:Tfp pilus assembly protein PilX